MSDFKKIFKLSLKRLSIWLILIFIFFVGVNTISSTNKVKIDKNELQKVISSMETKLQKESEYPSFQKIDSSYIKYTDNLASEFAKKYSLSYYLEKDYENFMREDDWKLIENKGLQEEYDIITNYKIIKNNFVENKYDTKNIYSSIMIVVVFIILIFTVLMTSVEESIGYYDFTRMFPWKKEKEFVMKIALSFLLAIGIFIINLAITFLILKSSVFGEILSFDGLSGFFVRSILVFLISSIISTSLGMLSGNILGHMGLLIIVIGGFNLIKLIVFDFISIFYNNIEKFILSFDKFVEKLPAYARVFVSLTNMDSKNISSIIGGLTVALLVGFFSYFIIKKSSAERSGYMVKNITLNNMCKILGMLTLTSILYSLSVNIFLTNKISINLLMYLLSLLLSFKFFDILFSIRLKF